MRLVADTNTLVSASLWQGPSARLLEAVASGKAELVLSPDLLAEFASVIARPKFVDRITAQRTTADQLAQKLAEKVTVVAPATLAVPPELRDPEDLPVLACALAADAEAIVSGDQDLLTMGAFQGIPILTAREALRKVGVERG
ncbi:MAG TPA: putative toxin-antitoxin system toxin component, PIN family [Verrucomicrobiota bacterium]|nr:putative toxin-antitoxin system toxin component, PIN family [Verrucomicrobiota bacterium]HRZ58868.1 putative toxin-antitoxin system toxin component, PIN family [Candidatus Paceibacterota bacterium]